MESRASIDARDTDEIKKEQERINRLAVRIPRLEKMP